MDEAFDDGSVRTGTLVCARLFLLSAYVLHHLLSALSYDYTRKVGLLAEVRDIISAAKGEERQLLLRLHDRIESDCRGADSSR